MTQSVQTTAMPPSLADMIPQDFQVLRELLEKTQPCQEAAPLAMCPLHLLLKNFYYIYITAQLDLDLRSLDTSGAIKTISSRCSDLQLLVKQLAQEIPDNSDPLPRAEPPAHDEWAERSDQVLKLSDAAKDLDASVTDLGTKRKEAREFEATREEIRQVLLNLNLTGHLRGFLNIDGHLDACLDLMDKIRGAISEIRRIRDV